MLLPLGGRWRACGMVHALPLYHVLSSDHRHGFTSEFRGGHRRAQRTVRSALGLFIAAAFIRRPLA